MADGSWQSGKYPGELLFQTRADSVSSALTTALTALPQTSKGTKLNCGLGTGAYSSKYPVGFGCASKLNERVDVNAGGSYVFG